MSDAAYADTTIVGGTGWSISRSSTQSFVNSTSQIPNDAPRNGRTRYGRRDTIVHVESIPVTVSRSFS